MWSTTISSLFTPKWHLLGLSAGLGGWRQQTAEQGSAEGRNSGLPPSSQQFVSVTCWYHWCCFLFMWDNDELMALRWIEQLWRMAASRGRSGLGLRLPSSERKEKEKKEKETSDCLKHATKTHNSQAQQSRYRRFYFASQISCWLACSDTANFHTDFYRIKFKTCKLPIVNFNLPFISVESVLLKVRERKETVKTPNYPLAPAGAPGHVTAACRKCPRLLGWFPRPVCRSVRVSMLQPQPSASQSHQNLPLWSRICMFLLTVLFASTLTGSGPHVGVLSPVWVALVAQNPAISWRSFSFFWFLFPSMFIKYQKSKWALLLTLAKALSDVWAPKHVKEEEKQPFIEIWAILSVKIVRN